MSSGAPHFCRCLPHRPLKASRTRPGMPRTVASSPSTKVACAFMAPARSYAPAFPSHEPLWMRSASTSSLKDANSTTAEAKSKVHVPATRRPDALHTRCLRPREGEAAWQGLPVHRGAGPARGSRRQGLPAWCRRRVPRFLDVRRRPPPPFVSQCGGLARPPFPESDAHSRGLGPRLDAVQLLPASAVDGLSLRPEQGARDHLKGGSRWKSAVRLPSTRRAGIQAGGACVAF